MSRRDPVRRIDVLEAAGVKTEYYESRIWGHLGMYLFDRRVLRRLIDFLHEHLD